MIYNIFNVYFALFNCILIFILFDILFVNYFFNITFATDTK